ENFEQLRLALVLATDAYTEPARPRTAFGHFAAHYDQQIVVGAARGLNPLVASFGPAQIDRAVLDALCRSAGSTSPTPSSAPSHLPATSATPECRANAARGSTNPSSTPPAAECATPRPAASATSCPVRISPPRPGWLCSRI